MEHVHGYMHEEQSDSSSSFKLRVLNLVMAETCRVIHESRILTDIPHSVELL